MTAAVNLDPSNGTPGTSGGPSRSAPLGAPDASVRAAFDAMKRTWQERQGLSYAERMSLLARLGDAIKAWEERLALAVSADFGNRSRHETALAEIFIPIAAVKYIRKHLRGWMRAEGRETSWLFMPAKNKVIHQPLGVVGIISPWNYPLQLALIPIAYAVAAGNRVLLKPSELTPKTSEVMTAMLAEVFPADVVSVVNGGPEVGIAFSHLPFDHLFFTGSTGVGRHVMRAAADNLVPVTLELGGKSPVLVHPEFPVDKAAERVAVGKLFNAGQTCIAPDYVLVREDQVDAFVRAFERESTKLYPRLADNPDYTSIVSDRHYARLNKLVEEARTRGARVIEVNPAGETLPAAGRKIAPTLVIGAPDDAAILQEEIFGPLLPVVTYSRLDDAIAYINARPRPLALYYFDRDGDRIRKVLSETTSGGACVNDTLLHVGQDDLPFGGVGPSGMGSYHGPEGFYTFSHKKAVFQQSRLNTVGLLSPPFGTRIDRMLDFVIGKARRR
jgi:acyl-CoA reductase-like NAD-dependent aldehyde dehydrogenase